MKDTVFSIATNQDSYTRDLFGVFGCECEYSYFAHIFCLNRYDLFEKVYNSSKQL